MGFLAEFKKFALRGNLMDMAVGFTVGAAFSTIAKSLVDNVIMPPVGLAIGKADFSDFYVLLKAGAKVAPPYASLEKAQAAGAVTLNYGLFINSIIAFLLVALAMFVIIRVFNKLDKSLEHSFITPQKPGEEPENKKCPFCVSTVPFKAVRCAYCTSDLSDEKKILNESKVGQELVAKAQAALAEKEAAEAASSQTADANSSDGSKKTSEKGAPTKIVNDMPLAPELVLAKANGEDVESTKQSEDSKKQAEEVKLIETSKAPADANVEIKKSA